jgi:hypothetical protein
MLALLHLMPPRRLSDKGTERGRCSRHLVGEIPRSVRFKLDACGGAAWRRQLELDDCTEDERARVVATAPPATWRRSRTLLERGLPVPGAVEVVAVKPREDVDVEMPEILVASRLVVLAG